MNQFSFKYCIYPMNYFNNFKVLKSNTIVWNSVCLDLTMCLSFLLLIPPQLISTRPPEVILFCHDVLLYCTVCYCVFSLVLSSFLNDCVAMDGILSERLFSHNILKLLLHGALLSITIIEKSTACLIIVSL